MTNSRGFFGSGGVAQGTSTSTPVNSRDLDSNYGPAFFDATHIVFAAGSYDLPFGRDRRFGSNWNRALDAVAGGWSVQFGVLAHSGYPITVLDSSSPSLQASRSTERPDRIGSGEVDHPTLERWIDRSAFVSAPLGQFGDSGIGILRAPSFWNADLTVGKRLATFGTPLRADSRRVLQRVQSSELRTAASEHPEHDFRHHHQHGQRSARRAVGGEVRVLSSAPDQPSPRLRWSAVASAKAEVPASTRTTRVGSGAERTSWIAESSWRRWRRYRRWRRCSRRPVPDYQIVTNHKPAARPGMPGSLSRARGHGPLARGASTRSPKRSTCRPSRR